MKIVWFSLTQQTGSQVFTGMFRATHLPLNSVNPISGIKKTTQQLFHFILNVHIGLLSSDYFIFTRQQEAPPLPIVINKYSDEHLRLVAQRLKERLKLYKEKVIDVYASSPEITPPVSEYDDIHHHYTHTLNSYDIVIDNIDP